MANITDEKLIELVAERSILLTSATNSITTNLKKMMHGKKLFALSDLFLLRPVWKKCCMEKNYLHLATFFYYDQFGKDDVGKEIICT